MSQSKIFLTHIQLDLDRLIPFLSCKILESLNKNQPFELKNLPQDNLNESITWQKYLNSGQIILPQWVAKKEFKEDLAELYKHYSQPTLLFLGSLNEISIPAQEGLLKFIEETPPNLHPILFSSNIFSIIPTIKSRCQILNLDVKICMKFLDASLLEKCKEKYPDVAQFTKNFLSGKSTDLTSLIKTDKNREEVQFWLWQVLQNLEAFYNQQPSKNVASKIQLVLQAMKLNSQSLQKRFVLEVLSC